jgi:glucose-1-phosphate thymidylyltransferase
VAIGEHVELEACYIGPYTSLGDHAKMSGATVENSIVFPHVTVRDCHIVDSVLGQNATVTKVPSHPPRGHQLVVGDNAFVQL